MENMEVYCNTCQKEVNHEVVEIKEGADCWLIITVKCSECGKVKDLNFYS